MRASAWRRRPITKLEKPDDVAMDDATATVMAWRFPFGGKCARNRPRLLPACGANPRVLAPAPNRGRIFRSCRLVRLLICSALACLATKAFAPCLILGLGLSN